MRRALFLPLLFLSCAKFGPPPGGPEDKTAPEIVSVFPASGSTKVDTASFFEFRFSKSVDRTSLARNVFVSPALIDSFHDELKGKIYRVFPNRYLAKGVTYVVTLGTGLRDLRGNPLAQAYSFSFSTGLTIDSGEIAGQVFEKTAPVLQAAVKAYRIADSAAEVNWKKPDYQTATGKDGRFKFSFLPSGRYRLLTQTAEKFGLYHRDVPAGKVGGKALPFQLFLETLDTAALALIDARFNRDRLLVLTFSRPLDFSDTLLTNFRLTAQGSIRLESAFFTPNEKEKLYCAADFPLREQEAKIYFSPPTAGGEKIPERDSATFLAGVGLDKTPPRLVWSLPPNHQERAGLSDTLKFYFSEPVTLLSGDLQPSLSDSFGTSVPLVWSQPQANAFFFVPSKTLRSAEWYRFRFPAQSAADRAGNLLVDSLWLTFHTFFPDSLGTVTGRVEKAARLGKTSSSVVLEFRELSSGWRKKETVSDSAFSISLLAGKYFLFGFSDLNGNQKRDPGALSPFSFPEPAFFYPDTIFVRARFETEGVDIAIR